MKDMASPLCIIIVIHLLTLASQIVSVPILLHDHHHHQHQPDAIAQPHSHPNPLTSRIPEVMDHESLPPSLSPPSVNNVRQEKLRTRRNVPQNQQQFQHHHNHPHKFRPQIDLPEPTGHPHQRSQQQHHQQQPQFHPRNPNIVNNNYHHHHEQPSGQQQPLQNNNYYGPLSPPPVVAGRNRMCPNENCRPGVEETHNNVKIPQNHNFDLEHGHNQQPNHNFQESRSGSRQNEYQDIHQQNHHHHVDRRDLLRHQQNEYHVQNNYHTEVMKRQQFEDVKVPVVPTLEIVPPSSSQPHHHLTLPITISTMKLIYPDDPRYNQIEDLSFILPNNDNQDEKTSSSNSGSSTSNPKTAILIIEFDMTDDDESCEATVETEEE